MGMQIFEKNGTFNPADWGLGAGDMVQVVCVGGGCSGDIGAIDNSNKDKSIQGKSGGNSSFGSYIKAFGGSQMDTKICMGLGGESAFDYERGDDIFCPGGGAGGYLIGIPFYGGNGGNGYYTKRTTTTPIPITDHLPSGLGASGAVSLGDGFYAFSANLPYANLYTLTGNKGAGHMGGNGYGAGGGAGGRVLGSATPQFCSGGNSGQIQFGTVKLPSEKAITVTVGKGGEPNSYSDLHINVTSGNGADGVVVVTW